MTDYRNIALMMMLACTVLAGGPVLDIEPRELRGVPGKPLRAVLTVETSEADPLRLQIPQVSNLFVRVVERVPIRRTETGRFVQQRVILWQGLDAGTTTLTYLTALLGGTTHRFPEIRIQIDEVDAARPPATEEAQ